MTVVPVVPCGAGAWVAGAPVPGVTLIVPVGVCAHALIENTGFKLSSATATNETTPQELGMIRLTPQDLVVEPDVT